MSLLESVKDFRGLHTLSSSQLTQLCSELREKILETTLKNGGHLASSLGAVELTVALLRTFNPDIDKIIFDVGHQTYSYKILTKRMEQFSSIRTKNGIAGFPRINESPYDFFTTGHSSTSISAAMGYAKTRDLTQGKGEVVAVIGDGALLNGVAFEALNCIQSTKTKVIIILNDNEMSINPRIGGMATHLANLAVNPTYRKFKDFIKEQCRSMKSGDTIESALSKVKSKLKSLILPVNIFEELDISYWGPFDGHNIHEMEDVFKLAKEYNESLIIHVITKKGKGYQQTEENPSFFHGIGPGTQLNAPYTAIKSTTSSWSSAMSAILCKFAKDDKRITACTAAMKDGTKLNNFAKRYPSRFFDVGISEEHMMVYAAGMAASGMRPVVCIYSTFLQRAADQVMHDICLSKLPVLIAIDRAGFVGEDGETHHGLFDIPWLRTIPDIEIAAPRDIIDLEFFVEEWLKKGTPFAIRYPRGNAVPSLPDNAESKERSPQKWGKCEILKHGKNICLIGTGSTVKLMLDASEAINRYCGAEVTVIDLRFIKPIDFETIKDAAMSHDLIITAEESSLTGGIGEAIAAFANNLPCSCKVTALGAPDRFIHHARRKEQWEECGMSVDNILRLCSEYEA